MPDPLRIQFAPDYRDGNPYQQFLATALEARGHTVDFLTNYRRGLPLARGGTKADVLHLHWPEKYFRSGDVLDTLRGWRFPIDLRIATRSRGIKLVTTAHNLWPHDLGPGSRVKANVRHLHKYADAVVAHSEAAADAIAEPLDLSRDKIQVIPHGDLSQGFPDLPDSTEAKQRLGLTETDGPLVLMFGAISRYKGIGKVLRWWRDSSFAATLAIVGGCRDKTYLAELEHLAGDLRSVHLHPEFASDDALSDWLAASDCTLFAYDDLLTSGSACLARSLGVPVVIGNWLKTVDLAEPSGLVHRFDEFDDSLGLAISAATQSAPDHEDISTWNASCSWDKVAALHETIYQLPPRN